MTTVKFMLEGANETRENRMTPFNYLGVEIEGHTKSEACQVISSVSLACASALYNITDNKSGLTVDDEKAYLFFGLNQDCYITSASNTVFDVLYMACQQVKEKYPEALTIEVLVQTNSAE